MEIQRVIMEDKVEAITLLQWKYVRSAGFLTDVSKVIQGSKSIGLTKA